MENTIEFATNSLLNELKIVGDKLRTRGLRSFQVSEVSPDKIVDSITSLSRFIAHTPVAGVCLISPDRTFVKSRVGDMLFQSPLRGSFVESIKDYNQIIINDMLEHPEYKDSYLVVNEPFIRFLVLTPIIHNSTITGALCAVNSMPSTIDRKQLRALRSLADLAGVLIRYEDVK